MGGETEADPEKPLDPIRCPRRQSGKVRVHMAHAQRLAAGTEVGGLVEAKEVGLSAPGGNFTRRLCGQLSLAQRRVHLPHQFLVPRQVSDVPNDGRFPVLRRFARGRRMEKIAGRAPCRPNSAISRKQKVWVNEGKRSKR